MALVLQVRIRLFSSFFFSLYFLVVWDYKLWIKMSRKLSAQIYCYYISTYPCASPFNVTTRLQFSVHHQDSFGFVFLRVE